MLSILVGMFFALLLSTVVVALVAVPARRTGRDLLTPEAEQLVGSARLTTRGARERGGASGARR